MKGRKIDKRPPNLTGDPKEDAQKVEDYLNYLRDQMNFILSTIYKYGKEDEHG